MLAPCLTALAFALLSQVPQPRTAFPLAELEQQLAKTGGNWLPFLDVPTLRTGFYKLPKGAEDGQSPHDQDEVYCVIAGKAALEVAGVRHEATAGSVLFVGARVPHRFVDIEEDLSVLVFFSAAVPESGGMAAAGRAPTRQTPYPETSPRGSTRIFYWFGPGSAGQVEIEYGLPKWQKAYEAMLAPKQPQRLRFGQNFWTRLDTNIELAIGGVALASGDYYLALETSKEHGVRLIALDPDAVRAKKLDAYQAPQTTGGIALPLESADDGKFSDRLRVELSLVPEEEDRALLEVRFGPHRFTAGVELMPE